MIKVKAFDFEHEQDLEIEINKFLLKIPRNRFVDIKYSVCNFVNNGEQIFSYSALIIYDVDAITNKSPQMAMRK